MGLITKIFGTYSERELKSIWPIVHQIEGMEAEYKAMTDAQLQAKTPEFKERLANGETLDLRTVPAVVGGDEEKRHGVVLAKSIPAKRYGIQTGESLFMARSKYPNLIVAAPDFDWYVKNSKAMIRIFGDYTPDIEQYSIDEAFLNMTGSEGLFGPPLQAAQTIKDRIHRELGFTVNIGIAPNRLLAKMASDFEKPDKIHVLTQDMVPQKLWPLPVGNLFGVGPKSVKRMHEIGIYTIGDLANADADILRGVFGVRGQVFRDYANGIESEPMTRSEVKDNSYGNSVTTPQDLKRPVEADATMLALCESVAGRLRMDGKTGLFIHEQDVFVLIDDVELWRGDGQIGVLGLRCFEKLVVDIKLEHVARVQPHIALDALAAELNALETDVFLHQRLRQQGNGLSDEAVEPLAGVIFAYLDLFHSMYHLHATIIADFQRIVNTNSC